MNLMPVLVKDIALGSRSSYAGGFTEVNGTLFFRANDITNGTELWKSDGTNAGTVLFKDIRPGNASSSPSNLTIFNGSLFFGANDGTSNGAGLWKSDGTEAGTVLVSSSVNYASSLTEANGTLFFVADDSNGQELWKSDGTETGTVLVKDIHPGITTYDSGYSIPNSSSPRDLTEFNGNLFFRANDGISGFELWKSDGTEAGTILLKDISPGFGGSGPRAFTEFNGSLFFTASDGINGAELWKTDGTEAGTVLVKDIRPGSSIDYAGYAYPNSSGPSGFTEFNGSLFFTADDGINGYELWKTDGTEAGTILVNDIFPGSSGGYPNSSSPSNFTEFNGSLFFTAADSTNGTELWKTNGTAPGTVFVADIFPGSRSSSPSNLTEFDDSLFFTANDGINGRELWTLTSSTSNVDPGTGIISNKVWFDTNGNGLFDAGEPGIASLPVVLTEAGTDGVFGTQDDITQTNTTNLAGNYRFRNLKGGTYKVSTRELPFGLGFTVANVGQNDALDSDVDPLTGTTGAIVLAPEQVNSQVDIGLVNPSDPNDPNIGIISNKVWFDNNANGLFDVSEAGIAGLTVVIEAESSSGEFEFVATKRTNGNGNYRFRNLPGGNYRVSLESLPEGLSYTTPNVGINEALDSDILSSTGTTEVITLAPGERNFQVDIGLL